MDFVALFEKLSADDIAHFIEIQQEEHLHLDFKTVGNANLNGRDDRRTLAVALSGFANSNGGLIVWGVDARKNAQGNDCAQTPKPISPLGLFVARLNELTGEAVSPIVDGIRHRALQTAADSGHAVTIVPENDSGPYMAKLGEDRYYKRSGDSFYRMEHFDLEDMFGRRQKPRLIIRIAASLAAEDEGGELLDLVFSMDNLGRAVAKHAGFLAKFDNVKLVAVSDELVDITSINAGPTVSYIRDIGVIHANGIPMRVGSARLRKLNVAAPINVTVTSYCEGARALTNTVAIAPHAPSAAPTPPMGTTGPANPFHSSP